MLEKLEAIVLQVTTKCPYNCKQCYMRHGNDELDIDVAKEFVDIAKQNGADMVQLTGGEPAIYPRLPELIKHISSKGIYSVLATSGYMHSNAFYSLLKSCGLTAMCISVNGFDQESNISTRDDFKTAYDAISEAGKCNIPCFVNTVVTDINIEQLYSIRSIVEGLGVVGINLLKPLNSFDGQYIPVLSKRSIKTICDLSNDDFFNIEGCFLECQQDKICGNKPIYCANVLGKTVFVNADGMVSPCSKLMNYKYKSINEMYEHIADWSVARCVVT